MADSWVGAEVFMGNEAVKSDEWSASEGLDYQRKEIGKGIGINNGGDAPVDFSLSLALSKNTPYQLFRTQDLIIPERQGSLSTLLPTPWGIFFLPIPQPCQPQHRNQSTPPALAPS